ncbi:MAG: hypothetical protein QXU20_02930 [Candidatus Woesearchaeota archaeon]
MRKEIFLLLFLITLFVFSGCTKEPKIKGEKVNACFFRECKKYDTINGWTTFFEGADQIVHFKNKEECIKKVYEHYKIEQRTYSSLDSMVYGLDYKYVEDLTNEEVRAVINLVENNRLNPHINYQEVSYDNLIKKYPKLSFLKFPCACNEFCVIPRTHLLNIKASIQELKMFSCGDKSDLEIGYYVIHNDCCWVKRYNCDLNPYSEECSWFKCGEIKNLNEIPSCGCLCGTEILARDTKKCCINGVPKSC